MGGNCGIGGPQKIMDEKETHSLNLGNLNNGAGLDLFERLQAEVLANIRDPNTAATTKRKLTLEFEYAPSADRKSCQVKISPKVKLAPPMSTVGTIHIAKIKGVVQGFVHDPNQDELRFAEPVAGKQ
jgi:hypothetical protein